MQSGVLQLVFKIADDNGLLLLDMKDLRAIVQYVGDNAKQFRTQYGNITSASIGAIQRGLLTLEEQGANQFLASRCWIFTISCKQIATGRALSIYWLLTA